MIIAVPILIVALSFPSSYAEIDFEDNMFIYRYDEPSIAINPINPNNVVLVMQTSVRVFSSFDMGETWLGPNMVPSSEEGLWTADPDIIADTNGNFYATYMSISRDGKSDLVISKSKDGGLSWKIVHVIKGEGKDLDRPWVAVDPNDTIHVAHTEFDLRSEPGKVSIKLTSSDNYGLDWSEPSVVSELFLSERMVQGSRWHGTLLSLATAPDGTLYVAWVEHVIASDGETNAFVAIARSGDGKVFSNRSVISEISPIVGSLDPILSKVNSQVKICAPSNSEVYAVWDEYSKDSAYVMFAFSEDGGETWSSKQRVTDSVNHQFFPAMACTDRVHVVWADITNVATDSEYHVYYSAYDDGEFGRNVRITDVASDPANCEFIGDYFDVAANEYVVFAAWTDARNGCEVFASRTVLKGYNTGENIAIVSSTLFSKDSTGNVIKVGNEATIHSTLYNRDENNKSFAYIVQIKDSNGIVTHISWYEQEINETIDASVSWLPEKIGSYTVEIFVWSDMHDPVPLSNPIRKNFWIG